MHVGMASSGGHAGRSNEDFAGAVPGAVVVLDGAGIPGTEEICSHGVAWYSHRLGGALLSRLARADGSGLAAILADAIDEVAGEHRGTCDIASVSSPQATVAIVRMRAGLLEYLVLADCFVVLDLVSAVPVVITDDREVVTRAACMAPLAGVARGTGEYEQVRAGCVTALQARRNQPGGYWIAKDDPAVAGEAVTGSCPLQDLAGAAVLSNGAARVVTPYGLMTWPGLLELLRDRGPQAVIRRVRQAEKSRADTADDATVAHLAGLQEASSAGRGADHALLSAPGRMPIARVVRRRELHDPDPDRGYWLSRTPAERLAHLEQLRREHHGWLDGTRPEFPRVLSRSASRIWFMSGGGYLPRANVPG